MDVLVIGSINVDLVVQTPTRPAPGETVLGESTTLLPGGKGANQAVAAARWGARTALVGAIGSDPNAQEALRLLRDSGVDLAQVFTVDDPTGLAVIVLSGDGENSIIVAPGANASVTAGVANRVAATIAASKVLVLQAEIPLETVARAAELGVASGTRVVLNVAPAAVLPQETIAAADPLVVNEHEAAVLLGRESVADDPVDAAVSLRELGARSVVVTLGSEGLVGADSSGSWTVPACKVEAVDTTGAGDAFVGALAAELSAGSGLTAAAETASRVAAAAVTAIGAQPSYPTNPRAAQAPR